MRLLLTALFGFAPAVHAQVVHRADAVFVTSATISATPRFSPGGRHDLTLDRSESSPTRPFDLSRALEVRSSSQRERFVLDSLGTPQPHGHALVGAILGLGLGAGTGYLVAIPRVRATERHGDGPFQQIEYLLDPVIGGVIGSIIGGVIGSHVR